MGSAKGVWSLGSGVDMRELRAVRNPDVVAAAKAKAHRWALRWAFGVAGTVRA
jgi:hypothetical protein